MSYRYKTVRSFIGFDWVATDQKRKVTVLNIESRLVRLYIHCYVAAITVIIGNRVANLARQIPAMHLVE